MRNLGAVQPVDPVADMHTLQAAVFHSGEALELQVGGDRFLSQRTLNKGGLPVARPQVCRGL
jgi:hypothetical protein